MTIAPDPARPKHVVVLAHPDADSFNASVAETYCETAHACGHETVLRDLYAMHFDPILRQDERPGRGPFEPAEDVQAELDLLCGASVLVLVYPIWFGSPPAMLKGYVDRVLGAGVTARQVQDRTWHALLGGRRLISFTSSAARGPWLSEQGQTLSLQTLFGDYLSHAFTMRTAEHVHFGSIAPDLSGREADEHLAQVRDHARRMCSLAGRDRSRERAL